MLSIGKLEISPPLVAAPMAGLSHRAFRRLLSELGGVGLFNTEMLSARALRHGSPWKSLHVSPSGSDRPLCLQIFASRPEEIGPAVERGEIWAPEVWDLNFGCPAPEIVKQGAGSALMASPATARSMAQEMRHRVRGPLVFKIRAFREKDLYRELLDILAGEGADALVVHARAPGEKYGRPAKWEKIAEAAERLSIPVIGNGDVSDAGDVSRMLETTGCRGVMIGRAAVERPWIFREAASRFGASLPPLAFRRKSEVFLRLAHLLAEELPPPRDLYRLKEFGVYFARNFKFGHQLWKKIHNARTMDEAGEKTAEFCRRHEGEDSLHE
jgi:nifR3 family TIM-barrel protein